MLETTEELVQEVDNSTKELNQNDALGILIQSIRIAQKRGAYELEETELILKAIKVFTVQK